MFNLQKKLFRRVPIFKNINNDLKVDVLHKNTLRAKSPE